MILSIENSSREGFGSKTARVFGSRVFKKSRFFVQGFAKLQGFLVQGFEKTARVFGSRVRKKMLGFFLVQGFEKIARVFWFKLQGFLVRGCVLIKSSRVFGKNSSRVFEKFGEKIVCGP